LHLTRVWLAISCLLLGLVPQPGHAFMPGGGEIAAKTEDLYASLVSYEAKIIFESAPDLEIVIWAAKDRWRQEWARSSADGSVVMAAAVGDKFSTYATYPQGLRTFPIPLTWGWQRPGFKSWLTSLGVAYLATGYNFIAGRPVLVVGSATGADLVPQIWVDKETFAPMRLVQVEPGLTAVWEWDDYRQVGGFNLPHKGQVVLGKVETVPFSIVWGGINRVSDPAVFSERNLSDKFGPGGSLEIPYPLSALYQKLPGLPHR